MFCLLTPIILLPLANDGQQPDRNVKEHFNSRADRFIGTASADNQNFQSSSHADISGEFRNLIESEDNSIPPSLGNVCVVAWVSR